MISRRCSPAATGDETELLLDVILEAGLTGSIPINGDEMRPAIEPDDRVIVTPFLGLPSPGQMVMAHYQGAVVARRLVDVRLSGGRRRYCLQADCGPARRFEVLREDLVGRPTAIIRRGVLTPLDDAPPGCNRAPRRVRGTLRRRR